MLPAIDPDRYEVAPIGIARDGRWLQVSGDRAGCAIGRDGELPSVENAATAGAEIVARPGGASGGLTVLSPGDVPRDLGAVDVVLPLLHGAYGEDGTIQGLLEMTGARYCGAGVFASAAGMDKEYMKLIFAARGLPIGPYVVVRARDWATPADAHASHAANLRRQHLKDAIQVTVEGDPKGHPQLNYVIATDALDRIAEMHLGKTILISNRSEWTDERIIEAYRSQFLIEAVFREMKDRTTGSWWPLNHWTDSKLRVHGLYCSMAQLLRSVIWRRIHQARLDMSMGRLLSQLEDIREVINLYPKRRKAAKMRQQTVLTRMSKVQKRLVEILGLEREGERELG